MQLSNIQDPAFTETLLARSSREEMIALGRAVIQTEIEALMGLMPRIDEHFVQACHFLLNCEGRIVVIGMGKSGHIANKIAATLASTGSPAFFVHPGEASHGDLGMITSKDVVLALSNSGETAEILTILPIIKRLGVPLIAMTGQVHSPLARQSNVHLDVRIEKEACPLGLAPTSSTTAALVMGDALAIGLLHARGFTEEDFARSHPGGQLGRKLLLLIDELMVTGDSIPIVPETATLAAGLVEMSSKGLGMTAVVDEAHKLMGIFTDGDLRRALDAGMNVHTAQMHQVMTRRCKTIKPGTLAAEALNIMEKSKINGLLVVDEENQLIGALNMHNLLRAGVL